MPKQKAQLKTGVHPFDLPFNGKLRLDVDPLLIGPENFRQLTNLRYTNSGVRGVLGSTKINVTPSGYHRIDGGYHFVKQRPDESHIFVQVSNPGTSASKLIKSNNTASVPDQDTFSDVTASIAYNKVNFSDAPDNAMVACDGVENYIWGGEKSRVSGFITSSATITTTDLTNPKDYTDQVNNNLTDAENRATTGQDFVVGSVRPLQGSSFYVWTANTVAATMGVSEWTGSGWSALTVTADTTATGGKTLAQTGTITWAPTTTTSKPCYINSRFSYFYNFHLSAAGTAVVFFVTVDAPMQPVTDLWDGVPNTIASAFADNSISLYYDYTSNLLKEDYYTASSLTYMDIGGTTLQTTSMYVGFTDRQGGLQFILPDFYYCNVETPITIVIYYWNGTAWASAGTLSDGTSSGGAPFNHSGNVIWNSVDPALEFKTKIADNNFYYYYKINVTGGHLTASVRVDAVFGITAQQQINAHSFSYLWQNRLWLFDEISAERNTGICSASGTNCVFNGSDSTTLSFGDGNQVMAASSIYSRYGGYIYDNLIVLKQSSVHLVDGVAPTGWRVYDVATNVGITATGTLQKCDINFDSAPGITKHVLMWQSARAIEYFDGNTLTPISDDIRIFFDPDNARYINVAICDQFNSYYDDRNFEYHWLFASGASSYLNEHWAFDLRRKKWYEVIRGSGNELRAAWSVEDPNGMKYNYGGGINDGYIQRLENGTSFNGTAIDHTLWTSDINISGSMEIVANVRHIKLSGIAKNTSNNNVALTYYVDGLLSGETVSPISQKDSTHRYYQVKRSLGFAGVSHSYKLEVSTSDETIGFAPLSLSGLFEIRREDL